MKLWHGGAPGRAVGDELLPPIVTRFTPTNRQLTGPPPHGKLAAYRPNLVYATSNREFAEVWALIYTQDKNRLGVGVVYQVALENAVPDEDLSSSGDCFQAKSGLIVDGPFLVESAHKRLAEVLSGYKQRGALERERRAGVTAKERAAAKMERLARQEAKRKRRQERK